MGSWISVIGGIGFFLLGMSMMADGLKAIAGDTLKKILNRFTGGTFSSITTGAVITLLVQSSTATTLMTIGFVSAGMLSFLQATGVIFGANLGTTSTGWFVAMIGLKFSISQLALPLVGFGVLLQQFGKGKLSKLGVVCAGFGLLFIGIQFLQDGMAGLNSYIDLSGIAGASIWSRLLLCVIGVAMTIIMQSSSAAVATTITLMAAATITFDQAIALIIGQNIGTTATAAIAAIGASVPAKRTALAHILFNLATGLVIFITLPLLVRGLLSISEGLGWNDPAMMLALFHTAFSLIGIVLFAPFIKQFTALITWMLPDRKSSVTQHLDEHILQIPEVALETAKRSLKEASVLTVTAMIKKFASITPGSHYYGKTETVNKELKVIQKELGEVRSFIEPIRAQTPQSAALYIHLLHALDHLMRLIRLMRSGMQEVHFTDVNNKPFDVVMQLQSKLARCLASLQQSEIELAAKELAEYSQELSQFRKQERANAFHATTTSDGIQLNEAFDYVRLVLLIDGLAYHLWRLTHHLSEEEAGELGNDV